jgi:TonB family protein
VSSSVSLIRMRPISRSLLILTLMLTFALSDTAQLTSEALAALVPLDSVGSCKAEGPVFADKGGKPVWLETDSLLKRATHCAAPKMPAMAQLARIEGQVTVNILVDGKGQVACAHLIRGHPLLAASAIDAAKNWTFRPTEQKGRSVSFYGHLTFRFSTAGARKVENPCTVAHW